MIPNVAPNTHQILISFPDWVYGVMTLGFMCFIFYLGSLHSNIKKVIKEFPKICRALDLISVKLKERGFFGESIYVSATSPVKLTPKGEELLKESKSNEFVDKYKAEFFCDIVLKELNFKIEDIDKHDPQLKKNASSQ